jgi:hypothetical protein
MGTFRQCHSEEYFRLKENVEDKFVRFAVFVPSLEQAFGKQRSLFARDIICERVQRHATCSASARPGCTLHPCHHKTRCQRPLHLTVSENYLILTVRIEMVTRSKPCQLERLANVLGLVMGAVGYQWKTFAFESV